MSSPAQNYLSKKYFLWLRLCQLITLSLTSDYWTLTRQSSWIFTLVFTDQYSYAHNFYNPLQAAAAGALFDVLLKYAATWHGEEKKKILIVLTLAVDLCNDHNFTPWTIRSNKIIYCTERISNNYWKEGKMNDFEWYFLSQNNFTCFLWILKNMCLSCLYLKHLFF